MVLTLYPPPVSWCPRSCSSQELSQRVPQWDEAGWVRVHDPEGEGVGDQDTAASATVTWPLQRRLLLSGDLAINTTVGKQNWDCDYSILGSVEYKRICRRVRQSKPVRAEDLTLPIGTSEKAFAHILSKSATRQSIQILLDLYNSTGDPSYEFCDMTRRCGHNSTVEGWMRVANMHGYD